MRIRVSVWLFLLPVMAGCGLPVQKVEVKAPLARPDQARPVPIRFGEVQSRVRRGDVYAGYVLGLTCVWPYDYVTWSHGRRLLDSVEFGDLFREEMGVAGYDVVARADQMFDMVEDEQRAELVVSAQITDVKMNLCRKLGLIILLQSTVKGLEADAAVTVDWTVYSALDRRIVYRTTTRGYIEMDQAAPDGDEIALAEAFAAAAANLAADPGFQAVGFAPGDRPDRGPALEPGGVPLRRTPEMRSVELPPAVTDGAARLQTVALPRLPPFRSPIQDHVGAVTAATVLIADGTGHGSGVLIGRDGLILTNAHVVGNAERVRVMLADGRALVGAVERRHKPRDVALVRVDGRDFPALPVRDRPVTVSEEVYAVGAPLEEKLHGSVTRGIVSALRSDHRTGLEAIQADVAIQSGNSGGPLVDAEGNLVALTVSGYGSANIGLNFFIPIGDALARLRLEPGALPVRLDGPRPPPT
jgi:serine protease Do